MNWAAASTLLRQRAVRAVLILLAINVVTGLLAGGVVYGYAAPQEALRDRLTNAMQALAHERATAAEDLAFAAANRAFLKDLLARGLTEPQNRLAAAALLERLREVHGLNGIHYTFGPATESTAGTGRLARLRIRTSSVVIDMSGVTDRDVLAYVRAVVQQLPGDVRVTALKLERLAEPDRRSLGRLRAGEPVTLVNGRLELEWRSLIMPEAPASARSSG